MKPRLTGIDTESLIALKWIQILAYWVFVMFIIIAPDDASPLALSLGYTFLAWGIIWVVVLHIRIVRELERRKKGDDKWGDGL